MAHLLNAGTRPSCSPPGRPGRRRASASTTATGSASSAATATARSTLLRLLTGGRTPDGGRVTHAGGLRVGSSTRTTCQPGGTVPRDVLGPERLAPTHEWAGDPACATVLDRAAVRHRGRGAGGCDAPVCRAVRRPAPPGRAGHAAARRRTTCWCSTSRRTTSTSRASTGWPRTCDPLAGRSRRARSSSPTTAGSSTPCAPRTWEVHDGVVDAYEGGYAAYVLARAERQRVAAVTEERRQNLLRKELAWLRRGPPARTSKPKFRIDAAAALDRRRAAAARRGRAARASPRARLGKDVVDLEGVPSPSARGRATHAADRRDLAARHRATGSASSASTAPGRRRCCGCWPARCVPDAGRVRRGSTVRMAVPDPGPARARRDRPPAGGRGRAARPAASVQVGGKEVSATQLVERLGLHRRARLDAGRGPLRRRAATAAAACGCLCTSRTYCCSTSRRTTWTPTRWPRWRTCSTAGRAPSSSSRTTGTCWSGSATGRWRCSATGGSATCPAGSRSTCRCGRRERPRRRRPRAPRPARGQRCRRPRRAAESRAARKELARLERAIEKVSTREARIHDEMAAAATDHERVLGLDQELRALLAEKESLEEAWLETAEAGENP